MSETEIKAVETEVKDIADKDLAHVTAVIDELRTELLGEPKKIEPVIVAAKGWLIATAFIFLVFGIVLGHYTAIAK